MTVSELLSDAFQDPEMAVFELDLEPFWRACPGIEPNGIFVIESSDGTAVATATARIDPGRPDIGILHRVAVRRSWHRRGLGRMVVVNALQHMANNGCESAIVTGMTNGLYAISLYLNLNFEPTIDNFKTHSLWMEVYEFLSQVTPSNRDIFQRLPLEKSGEEWQSPTVSTETSWIDDFITEDDEVWLVQATIDSVAHRMKFGNETLSPEDFVQRLVQNGIDRALPIVLRWQQNGSHGTELDQVLELLRVAGFKFSAGIGQMVTGECLSFFEVRES